MRRALAAGLAALLLAAPAARAAPPQPDGYRLEDFRSPTPAALTGAETVTTARAERLWRAGAAFVDVLPRPPRPTTLPPGTIWRDAPHDSIPHARWLPNTGFGELAPQTEAYFRHGLSAATGGDPDKPVVLFCQRNCWMSWNAAKRALALGYRHVHWYPDGTDGWGEAGLPFARAEPAGP
ncbi:MULTISPECIES: PQQ-dependent catabolism-associated CXXCW motif protein [Methylobacterium]|uniref:PQQ-dependent catabolism-associated CXXCW motif protein n=2 Tax=Methylobacteriaceae TaxID=119045 RepID=UPI0008EA2CF8|nr:PQQ-dependent catabolism-associated CXXCW motif protein [Methylobacterium sp. yr596]MBK3396261.1 PQQ-dependent catabolism-associated CXXCW motif protein [Methylobacterium ajmalii]MBK3412757.1 PQQ-dependent catabolism-associated CXXCW motif protein [Methylobacterium ajmalii]MBZ6416896.1 PQQ-dependent catabolism-associated CXXCW motif protein [Methylobacterium sp.]SFF84404.1 PQQ-dependent catabolism-associated CXXCW motif protein [Methylobacterium sp. yr596]